MFNLEEYVKNALQSFRDDPADSDHQRGYQACLEEIARVANIKTGE